MAGIILTNLFPDMVPVLRSGLQIREAADYVASYPFSVHVLQVGNADAIYLHTRQADILIDGGTYDCGPVICQYLQRRNVTKLDLVINTHADEDHFGGLPAVLEQFPVEEYWCTTLTVEDKLGRYQEVSRILEEKKIPVYTPKVGEWKNFGALSLRVLGPTDTTRQDSNNRSLVLRACYQQTSLLLMGDAEKEEENDLLATWAQPALQADLIKIGHHGSRFSSTEEWLQAVSPQGALISGQGDYPYKEVLDRLHDLHVSTFTTEEEGTLVCGSDGLSWYIRTDNGTEAHFTHETTDY
ncbi:MAG: ComEC/Rec2 family competence protein [Acutalibacteraceae bacterium]